MAYIIKNDQIVAKVSNLHAAGNCEYCYNWVKEDVNANFDFVGVNRGTAKISHAKKWGKQERRGLDVPSAVVLDKYFERDFLVLSDDTETPAQAGWEWENRGE